MPHPSQRYHRFYRRRRRRAPMRSSRRRRVRPMRVARTMRPRTYNFTRSMIDQIQLNSTEPPAGWTRNGNAIVQSRGFKLSDLPNYTEFTQLFSQYRILAIKQEYYFTDTGSINVAVGTNNNVGAKQIMLWANPNAVGKNNTSALTEGFFLQSQVSKKRLCLHASGRPIKLYTKCKQLSEIFSDEEGNTDYAKSYPKFVSTGEPDTEHYGLDIRLGRLDENVFSHDGSNYPTCKIITKVYLQCRQVS